MGAVETIAGYAGIQSIPWQSLDQQGAGFMASNAYIELIRAERTRWQINAAKLGFTEAEILAAADNAKAAWQSVYDEISSRASAVLAAIAHGNPSVAFQDAVSLPLDALRATVIACAAMADAGARAHETYVMRWIVETGEWTVERAEKDADQILGMYDALSRLAESGVLAPLAHTPASTSGLGWMSGLGIAAIPAIAIALAVVGTISVLSWLIITWREQSYVYDMWDKKCFEQNAAHKPIESAVCTAYFNNLAKDPHGHLVAAFAPWGKAAAALGGEFGQALGWALGLTAMLYVGARWILPALEKGGSLKRLRA